MNSEVKTVYFAHPISTYKTIIERKALEIISKKFPKTKIINPSKYMYIEHSAGMRLFKRFVKHSDILVYIDIAGFITAGVAVEIEEARKKGIEIYRLDWRSGKLEKVERIKEYILDPAQTKKLNEMLKKKRIDDEMLKHKINEIFRKYGSLIPWIALKIAANEISSQRKAGEILLNPLEKYYHWWQEPEYIQLPIDNEKIAELLNEEMKNVKAKNIGELLRKYNVGEFEASYHYCYRILNKLVTKSTVKGLVRLCNQLNIPYIELEKRKIFPKHNFPYNQADPALWKLATHVLNEGSIDKKHVISYANKDPVLHWYFKKAVTEAGGKYYGPYKAKNKLLYESHADPLTGRRLTMIGVPQGAKTIHEPVIDLSKMTPEAWKYHIQTTIAEEGSATLRESKKEWVGMCIEWSRGIDVTKYVPKDILSTLEPGKHRVSVILKEIPEIYEILLLHPPKLLLQEHNELIRRHEDEIPRRKWHDIYLSQVYISKDQRISTVWKLYIISQTLVELVAEKYGILPGTWKEYIFRKQYEFYKKHVGTRLTEEDYNEYLEIKKTYSYRNLNKEWINRKLEEYFSA